MAVIARGYIYTFVIQIVIYQVSSSQPVTQYVLSNYAPANTPTQPTARPSPPTNLPTPSKPLPKPEVSGRLDSNVLNNLAIALQLLIVSNIMNMPPEKDCTNKNERITVPKNEYANLNAYPSDLQSLIDQALSKPSLYSLESKPRSLYETQGKPSMYSLEAHGLSKPSFYSYEASLPNANFLGSSGFTEPVYRPSVGISKPNPRSSMTLMSPYDALGTSSFADPLSSFPSTYSKNDFQSPYASILAADGARDLFSTADFF